MQDGRIELPCKYFVYGPKKSKARVKSVNNTNKNTVNCETFLLQSFGTSNSLLASKNIYVTVPVFVLFKAISKYKPSGAYIRRGDLTEESFCITSLGGLYLEGLTRGRIFPESSVQCIAQVSNRDKTLSRFRMLWNVLILSSSILSYLWLCF